MHGWDTPVLLRRHLDLELAKTGIAHQLGLSRRAMFGLTARERMPNDRMKVTGLGQLVVDRWMTNRRLTDRAPSNA